MVGAGQYFLQSYDECKSSRTAQECRGTIANLAPSFIRAYLASYDTCLRGFKTAACRRSFAPEGGGLPVWSLVAAFGIGVLIGKRW